VDDSIDQVLEAVAGWSRHAEDHGLPKSVTAMVGQQHGLVT
jgi:hypothetical protein